MRKGIVAAACVLAALATVAGLRLFGFIGFNCGDTGIAGDPVRFGASLLALRLLRGEPDAVQHHALDTPFDFWRYEDQVAFGRRCAIEYGLHRGDGFGEALTEGGVFSVEADIPLDGGEDGRRLADEIYRRMLHIYARKGGKLVEGGWSSSALEGAPLKIGVSAQYGATSYDFSLALYADHLLVSTVGNF